MPPQQPERHVTSSKQLERWAPGLMNAISASIIKEVYKQSPQLKVLSWDEHVRFGHVPYRKDCFVCQQSAQQVFPHRKNPSPQPGVLALDTCGPLLPASDVGSWKCRYFLAGAYTFMVPKGSSKMTPPPEEEGNLDAAPALETGEVGSDGEAVAPAQELQGPIRLPSDGEAVAPAEDVQGPIRLPSGGDAAAPAEDLQGPVRRPPVGEAPGDLAPEGPPQEEEEEDKEEKGVEQEEAEIRLFKLVLPLRSKKAKEVTRAAMEMILKLKIDGYHVNRIHSDRGHEFLGSFETWMKSRGIILTKTSGDDPKANGRAEVVVKSAKNQVRRILLHAEVDSSWWPWALRYLNEVYRCQRLDQAPEFPRFLQDVLVRRRQWKKKAFEPTVETAKYLCPAPEDNGHWIKVGDEPPRVTRCFMRKALEHPDEGVWLAVEREVADALTKRRRLRGKTTVRKLRMTEEDEEDDVMKVAKMRVQFTKVVEEEMRSMLDDDPELVSEEIEILARLKKMLNAAEGGEDDEVLQTRIISPQEVSKRWSEWLPAIEAEVNSLLQEKEAMEEISGSRLKELLHEAEENGVAVEFLPSKLVFTKKPGKKGGRPKVRWVICGNFEQKRDDESTYSSGADAAALRLLLVTSSRMQWTAGTIDVKTAFLNAVMDQQGQKTLLLVKPPQLFLEKGYMKLGTYYLPKRAVYGLRRSPKLWGECRDEGLESMEIEVEEETGQKVLLELLPLESEPNLWRIQSKEDSELENEDSAPLPLRGLLMTYVDDILVTGSSAVVQAVMEKIRSTWTTTEPDQVNEVPIKFLGVEISKVFDEKKGRDLWYMSQSSYIQDLLAQSEKEISEKKVPITRDQGQLPDQEEHRTPELVKLAQKATGEMLWLVTRTRIDLMYAVSKMGSNVTKSPRKVLQIYEQIKGYLKKTVYHGLCFDGAAPEMMMIEAMADASFAPDGDVSHGAFIIEVGQCPVFWRSGRQSFVTLSTAEAEMMEVIESMVAGESIGAIADELFGSLSRKSWTDSQSALAILTTDGGSWRTRHLRLRAAAARHSIAQGMWVIQHMAGSKMTADIGTKPLASERLKQLKEEMHMVEVPHAKVENVNHAPLPLQKKPGELKERFSGEEEIKKAASIVRLLTLAAVLSVAKSEDEDEDWSEDGHSQEFTAMMVIFALVIVAVTLLCQKFWVLLRSQLHLNNQNTKGKEEKGKDGDAVAPAEDVQGPIRRPSGGDAVAPAEDVQGPIRRPVRRRRPWPPLRRCRDPFGARQAATPWPLLRMCRDPFGARHAVRPWPLLRSCRDPFGSRQVVRPWPLRRNCRDPFGSHQWARHGLRHHLPSCLHKWMWPRLSRQLLRSSHKMRYRRSPHLEAVRHIAPLMKDTSQISMWKEH